LTYHGLLGDYSRDVASTSVDLKPANRRSANDQIQKSDWETWKSEYRAWLVFAKHRSRKSDQDESSGECPRIKVHSPLPLIHFQAPSILIPSLHVYSESDVSPIEVPQQQARRGWLRF